jgi:hypothetical protein
VLGGDPGEPVRELLAGRGADQLVAQVAVGQGVLGAGGAGLVQRGRAGQQRHERLAVVVRHVVGALRERRQPGLVGEHVPHGGGALPVRGVRGPEVGDRLVEGEGSLGDRGEHGEGRERLGHRVGHHQGVGRPRARAVAGAGHRLVGDRAVADDAGGGARSGQPVEQLLQGPGHEAILPQRHNGTHE